MSATTNAATQANEIIARHANCNEIVCNSKPYNPAECLVADKVRPLVSALADAKAVISAISDDDWRAIVNGCGACGEAAQVEQDPSIHCERHDFLFAALAALNAENGACA